MNNNIMDYKRQIRSLLFLAAIMVITSYVFLRDYSIKELLEALKNTNYFYLLIGLCLMLIFIICEALNIKIILKVLGKEVSFYKSLRYSWIGFYFSAITPSSSGGQPAQVYYMKKDSISVSDSTITLFFIVFIYQIAMVLLGGLMAVMNQKIAYGFINSLPLLFLYGIIMNVGAIFFFMALMFSKRLMPRLLNYLLQICYKLHIIKDITTAKTKISIALDDYHAKSYILKKHNKLFIKVLSITILQMLALNMVAYMVYLSMGYHNHGMFELITSQSLHTISVSAIPLPGSVGAAEGAFLQAYANIIPLVSLKPAMVISRCISFYIPFIISFLLFLTYHIKGIHHTKLR